MVIGYISIASTSNPPVSFIEDILNEDIYSSDSYAAASNGVPQASDYGFRLDFYSASYIDPNTGVLYATGYNSYGQLGLGTTTNAESFTAIYKSGDKDDKFLNPIDWASGEYATAVIDNDGKLWTSGYQRYGALGNGVIGDKQTSFELVTEGANGLPTGYKAEAVSTGGNDYNTIVMLDDGSFYGAGDYRGLGLSATGGYTSADVEGGGYYKYFTVLTPTWASSRKVVDFKVGNFQSLWLLDDGTLWRANASGWAQVSASGVTVSTFDTQYNAFYYVTSTGDVYYGTSKILSAADYTGSIASIYTGGSSCGWAYLTTDGDVYWANTDGGTTFYKIAEDVIYFDQGGYGSAVFGAITTDGTFKLWGSDSIGQLGNGAGQTDNKPDTSEGGDPMAAFKSDVANVYNYKTSDGGDIVLPEVNEDGLTESGAAGAHPTHSSPAPAK